MKVQVPDVARTVGKWFIAFCKRNEWKIDLLMGMLYLMSLRGLVGNSAKLSTIYLDVIFTGFFLFCAGREYERKKVG